MAARRLIEKTRRRLEREIGTVYKPHSGRLRFALAFPSSYFVGMSNLGFQTVYRLLNDRESVVCERVFLPDDPDLEDLTRSGTALFTMESQTAVRDFDVLAFSLSYELDYPNVLRILSLSKLPELADERGDESPLVIAGGPAATFNPEPLAPFIDLFVIGEAEEVVPELVESLLRHRDLDRADLLLKLAAIDGVYVPRFYEPEYHEDGTLRRMNRSGDVPARIRRRWVRTLAPYAATSAILTPETEFSNMILAEVARGCGRQCRFCVAGYAYLPPRAGSAETLLDGIRKAGEKALQRSHEHPRIGLLSASVFDHPSSLLICQALVERERIFSISSTRADTLNKDIVETLHRGGHETLTIAPEAGSERLRRVINKAMTDKDIISAAALAWDGGFRRLKLYFMLGLPTEEAADVAGISALVGEISRMFRWEKLIASISCFVPKPWTPFQWAPVEEEKLLAAKIAEIRRALRSATRVEVSAESPREAVAQAVLARGDRRLTGALIALSREQISWRAAFVKGGVDPFFYAHRARHKDEVLPWDHLDLGIHKQYLWHEYERAMKAAPTPACIVGTCRRCGVCHD
jgi:radical SAM family uncharacterized protein